MGNVNRMHGERSGGLTPGKGRAISRRALLSTMGAAGMAAAMGSFAKAAGAGPGVTDSVYGGVIAGGPDGEYARLTPNELMKLKLCLSATIGELRAGKRPLMSNVYYVTDLGREGVFVYDASDTTSADNDGTIVVTASGDRYIRRTEAASPIDVRWFGAKGDGVNDDTDAIQAALEEALRLGSAVIRVPAGRYKLTRSLNLYRNTRLLLDDTAVLLRSHRGALLMNYKTSDIFYGYEGNGNITIEGGVLDCNAAGFLNPSVGIALAHSSGITIRRVTLKDVPLGHAVELTGVENVRIDECAFLGFVGDKDRYYVEAIQLEPATQAGFGGFAKDHTATRLVTVTHCYFGGSGTPGTAPWPCGIGAHSAGADKFYDNITVTNNTFEGSSYWAIRPFKWRNSIVSGNYIRRAAGGIFITMPAPGSASTKDEHGVVWPTQPASNLVVESNIIEGASGTGIYVEGQQAAPIHNVVITGNVFRQVGGHVIQLKSCDSSIVSDNIMETGAKNGLLVADCTRTELTGNVMRDIGFYGFNVGGAASLLTIRDNKMINVSQIGDNRYDGIYLSGSSSDFRVIGNQIRTEPGKAKPRYGMNIHNTVTNVTRYGNDLRCEAVSGSLRDLSPEPVTSPVDME